MSMIKVILAVMLIGLFMVQSPDPPISDTRLSIHTLVREDIFAGFLADDMERFARGEKNIQLLLEKRPEARPELLAWKGGATLYRAVKAVENNDKMAYNKYYQAAMDNFAESKKLSTGSEGAAATMGGSFAILGDRLAPEHRQQAWAQAYENYMALWKKQGAAVDKMPLHIKGELLAGLTQSAQRTGRKQEMSEFVDKMLLYLPGTPYESAAKLWKTNPEKAATSSVTCRTCHDAGKLSAKLAALNK